MCSVVIFVISLHFLHVHGDYYNTLRWSVTKELYSKDEFELPTPGLILKNGKPLRIILEGYKASKTFASCWNKIDRNSFSPTFYPEREAGKDVFIIEVKQITDDMSTVWQCRIWNTFFKYQYYTFVIHIKGKDQVKMTIGRRQINYALTDLSVVDHDGVVEYWYQNGQTVDLVCESELKVKHQGQIRLKYYNVNGTELFKTDKTNEARYPLYLRKTLKMDNNRDYIDCTYISKYAIEYTYRTIFRFLSNFKPKNPIRITVNGKKLVPIQSDGDKEGYQYRFYDGEILAVTCEMDGDTTSRLSLGSKYPDLDANLQAVGENSSKKSTKTLKMVQNFNKNSLICDSSRRGSEISAEIFFILDETDPIILGLSASDVIQQYNKNFVNWIIDYWYTLDQTLNLTCVSKRPDNSYQWFVKRNSKEDAIKSSTNNFVFSSNQEANRTTIICDTKSGTTIVNLYVKPVLASNNYLLIEGPTIQGLIEEDIIGKPSKNATFWIVDYWYSEGQTQNLTCVSKSDTYQWLAIHGARRKYLTGTGRYKTCVFTLTQDDNGTSIICEVMSKRAIVNFYLKDRPKPELPTPDEMPNQAPEGQILLIVASSVAVSIVAIITVTWIICCRMRKHKFTKQNSRENLTRELDRQIPAYPSQWNDTPDYVNTEDGIMITNSLYEACGSPIYARVLKKAKRNVEPIYNNTEELNYGNVGNNNGGEYAQVCKKKKAVERALRGNSSKTEPEPEALYSEIP